MNEEKTPSVDVLELLLKAEPTKLLEKQVKLKRFSELCGADVIFKLRGLPYNRAAELQNDTTEDTNVHIVLAGVTDPSLKDKALMEKYGVPTPAELVKKMLLPGEIVDLAREVEKLSGFRATTIEDVKKKIDNDPETQLMYYLFTQLGLLPGDYYSLPAGDKVVIRAFWETYMGVLSKRAKHKGNPRFDKNAIKRRS